LPFIFKALLLKSYPFALSALGLRAHRNRALLLNSFSLEPLALSAHHHYFCRTYRRCLVYDNNVWWLSYNNYFRLLPYNHNPVLRNRRGGNAINAAAK
jgi:hypothetical protein